AEAASSARVREELAHYKIEEIVPLEWAEVFMQSVNTFLIVLKKEPVTPHHTLKIRQGIRHLSQLEDLSAGSITEINQKEWVDLSPDRSWRLEVTAEDIPILNKLKNYPKPFRGSYGMALRAKKEMISSDPSKLRNPQPILDGREVKSWAIEWQGRYVDYIPEEISDPKSPDFFKPPLILMPEISLTTNAVVIEDNFFFKNTLLRVDHESSDPYVSAAIINSTLNRYFAALLLRSGIIQKGWSHFYPRVISQFISPPNWLKVEKGLGELSRLCHQLADEISRGEYRVSTELDRLVEGSPRRLCDLPEVQFGSFDQVKLETISLDEREGLVSDSSLVLAKGPFGALFFVFFYSQFKGREVLRKKELESHPLPADESTLLKANSIIRDWLDRKPTLMDQLEETEAKMDDLIFSASDLTSKEIETIRRRVSE
ncbi:MAG: TaqI-like C-terminal specificity domain-containing protein, partial [Candidatus Bathyarchaeia archaeon]